MTDHEMGTCDANCSECENDRATAGDRAAWHSQDR